MSQAPVMPLFTDALIGDTMHLSTMQFGAYVLILIATWRNNGQAFPDNARMLSRVCRVSLKQWTSLRPVLVSFFDISDGCWCQKRLKKEWDNVQNRSAKSRENAEARWLKTNDRPDATAYANGHANDHAKSMLPYPYPISTTKGYISKPRTSARAREGTGSLDGNLLVQSGLSVSEEQWRKRLGGFVATKFWNGNWGFRPDEPACYAPTRLLAEFGFR